jgi:peptidoglycan-N-acetylglucosamine deacetylase
MTSSRKKLAGRQAGLPPVFADLYGGRYRAARAIFIFVWVLFATWAGLLSISLFRNDPAETATLQQVEGARSSQAAVANAMAASYTVGGEDHDVKRFEASATCVVPQQPLGSALAAKIDPHRVFGFLPNDPAGAYLTALKHCDDLDVMIPEWFEITKDKMDLAPIALDAEMAEAMAPLLQNSTAGPQFMPTVDLAFDADRPAFLKALGDAEYRQKLTSQIVAATQKIKASGVCLTLDFLANSDLSNVAKLLNDLRTGFAPSGKSVCVIVSVEQDFWKQPEIIANSDIVVVQMFRSVWVGSKPGPLASDEDLAPLAAEVVKTVGAQRLVMAIGGMAVDWISGQPIPEEITFSEAMARIAKAGAEVKFSPSALNSFASYSDQAGKRHQIWMLDAVSTQNTIEMLNGLGATRIAIWPLGGEDPGIWPVVDSLAKGTPLAKDALRVVSLSDEVSHSGEGAFYRLTAMPRTGVRDLVVDGASGKITGQSYSALPQPYLMEHFGAGNGLQVALTFDDGPSADATPKVLDALKQAKVPATFFVVGSEALAEPDLLRRMVAEGHVIGSHTFFHPHLETTSPGRLAIEMNAVKSLIAGEVGHTVRLFRPPYVRGPGPLTGAEADAFRTVNDLGYTVVGSDIVPPDWTGISADKIVKEVISGLNDGYGNVVVLHDGHGMGMHTVEAIPKLVQAIRAEGYEIVPLATLLGTTSQALMPVADKASAAIGSLSFGTIGFFVRISVTLFWIFLMAGMARSVALLIAAARREPQRDLWARNLRVGKLPSVTVVIPAFNEESVILESVRTALAVDYPDLKVIVVDDGSTDDTLAVLRAAYGEHPQIRIISQANQGKWKALNSAYEAIDTEIAVCVDADTHIDPGAIRHLVQPFRFPKVGAVAGTVLVGNKRNLLTRLQALEYFTMQIVGRRSFEYINGIIVVPGALGAWRVKAVRDIGLFTNDTLTEDADLTIWMLRGGYRIAYADQATGYTEAPADIRSLLKQRRRWNLGMLQALWKHRGAFGERGLRVTPLVDLALFGYVLPLAAPLIDLLFVSSVVQAVLPILAGQWPQPSEASLLIIQGYIVLPLLDILTAVVAFRLDRRESKSLLWYLPFQRFYYRQLMYFSVYQAVFAAISGRVANWEKLKRFGMAQRVS